MQTYVGRRNILEKTVNVATKLPVLNAKVLKNTESLKTGRKISAVNQFIGSGAVRDAAVWTW